MICYAFADSVETRVDSSLDLMISKSHSSTYVINDSFTVLTLKTNTWHIVHITIVIILFGIILIILCGAKNTISSKLTLSRVPTGPEKYWKVMKFDFSFFRTWKVLNLDMGAEKVLIFASVILKNQDTESVIFFSNICS